MLQVCVCFFTNITVSSKSISITRRQHGALTVVESTKVPGEVVALTRYRELQFSSLHLGQGESPPRGSVEMRENEYE